MFTELVYKGMKKCVNFEKCLLPQLNLFYMQKLKWILFERENIPKEKNLS